MILYLLFFTAQILIISTSRLVGIKNNMLLLTTLISVTVLLAGLRGNIGTDTFAYREYFNNFGANEQDVFFEPTFALLSIIGKSLGLNSQFLIFATALLQGIFIYLSIRLIKEKDLYYLLIVSTYYTSLNLNLIRVGLAIYIVGYALLLMESNRLAQSKLAVTLASLTHLSTLITIPFFWKRWYYLIMPLSIIVYINVDLIQQKLFAYFIEGNLATSDFHIGIGFFATNLLLLSCLHRERLLSNKLIIVFFTTAFILKVASFSIPIFDRLAIIFEFMLLTLLLSKIQFNRSKLIFGFIIIYNIYKSIAFIANSDEAMQILILEYPGMASLYGDTHWIPYQFFWE